LNELIDTPPDTYWLDVSKDLAACEAATSGFLAGPVSIIPGIFRPSSYIL